MNICVSPGLANKLDPFGGRVFSTVLYKEAANTFRDKYPTFEVDDIDISYNSKAAKPLTVKFKIGNDVLDFSEAANNIYTFIFSGKTDYHAYNVVELITNFGIAQDTPQYKFVEGAVSTYNQKTLSEKVQISKQIKKSLKTGDIQFTDDSLYAEFSAFVFKTNQGGKWFANISDYKQHPNQKTIGETLDDYIKYSKKQGVLSYIQEQGEMERKISILKDKLAGFRVSLEEVEDNKEEGDQFNKDANMQSASSYAGSQVKLYLSTIKNPSGKFYTSEQLIGMLIQELEGLSDEQVVQKLKDAAPGSYLNQIYNDLYETRVLEVDPKTPLAVLEAINDQERTKLRFDFQAFVQKVKTPPLATFRDGDITMLTNKLVENQTYVIRKNINAALVKLASGTSFDVTPLFVNSKTSGKEILSVDPAIAQSFSITMRTLNEVGYNAATSDVITDFVKHLYQIGIIPSLFENAEEAQNFIGNLDADEQNSLFNALRSLSSALLDVAAESNLKESAHTIFENQTNQAASADNVPFLKIAANAYDQVIESILAKNNQYVRAYVYFKDNGSKVYALSLPTTVHRTIANFKASSRLPYSVSANVPQSRINSISVAEYVQHEDNSEDQELVFSSFQKDDHFKGIVALLARGHNPFSRAAERGIQRTLSVDLLDATPNTVINTLGNRLVYEITTAVYNKLMLKSNPKLFKGLHFSGVATKLRQFESFELDSVIDTIASRLENAEITPENIRATVIETLGFETDGDFAVVPSEDTDLRSKIYSTFIDKNTQQFEKYLTKYYGEFNGQRLKNTFGVAFARLFTEDFGLEVVPNSLIAEKLASIFLESKNLEFSLIFGDVGNVSATNFNKRATLYQSTKQANLTSEITAETMDQLFTRIDGRNRLSLYQTFGEIPLTSLLLNELQVSGSPFEKYLRKYYTRSLSPIYTDPTALKNAVDKAVSADIDAADGATFISLDHIRDYFLQNQATQWTSKHEQLFQYEAQKQLWSYIINGLTYEDFGIKDQSGPLMTIDQFNAIFSKHLSQPLTEENITSFRPENFGVVIKPEDISVSFGLIKPAGTSRILGRQINNDLIVEPFSVNHINANIKTAGTLRTTSTANLVEVEYKGKKVLVPSPTNTNYKMLAYMFAGKIDHLAMPSARKESKDSANDSVKVSKEKGFTVNSKSDYVVDFVSGIGYGKQVDTATEEKNKVTLSTQLRRLVGLNMVHIIDTMYSDNPEMRDSKRKNLDDALNELFNGLNAMSLNKFVSNLTELGFEFSNQNGQIKFKFDSTDEQKRVELINKLLSAYSSRSVNLAVKDSLEFLLDSTDGYFKFDLTLAKDDVENSLSKVVKGANNIKVYGEGFVQDTGFGYDESLRMYSYTEGAEEITRAEVMVPLPRKLVFYVNKNYKGSSFEERLQKFNSDVQTFNETGKGLPSDFKQVLNFIANRTPSQSTASVEAFNIKKFLVPWAGPRIVLPLEFPLKSGSDYDVDKLSSYLNSFTFDNNGNPIVTLINSTDSVETVALKLAEYYVNETKTAGKFSVSDDLLSTINLIYVGSSYNQKDLDVASARSTEVQQILKELSDVKSELVEIKGDEITNQSIKLYNTIQKELRPIESKILATSGTLKNKQTKIEAAELELYKKHWSQYFKEEINDYDVFKTNLASTVQYTEDQIKAIQLAKQKLYNFVKQLINDANAKNLNGVELVTPTSVHSNNFVNNYAKIYLQPENIDLIYSPIGAPYLKTLATETLAKKSAVKTYADLFTIEHELETFEAFMGGDKSIGQAAIANVLHSLAQHKPIRLVDSDLLSVGLLFEKRAKEFLIGYLYDGAGRLKSDTYNEQITGYVDVAKDPFIMRLLVNLRTYNIFHFMHEVYGVPPDHITKFFALPGIYERLTNKGAILPSPNDEFVSKVKKLAENLPQGDSYNNIGDTLLDKFYWYNLQQFAEEGQEITIDYINELTDEQLAQLFKNAKITQSDIKMLLKANFTMQPLLIGSKQLKNLKNYQRPDSSFVQKAISIRLKEFDVKELFEESVFDTADISRFISETYLKQQQDNQFSLITSESFNKLGLGNKGIFSEFFLMEDRRIVDNIINLYLPSISSISLPERVLDNKLRKINDIILTGLFSAATGLKSKFEDLLLKEDFHNALHTIKSEIQEQDSLLDTEKEKVLKFINKLLANTKSLASTKDKKPIDVVNAVNVFNEKAAIDEQYMLKDAFDILSVADFTDPDTGDATELSEAVDLFNSEIVNLMMLQFGFVNGPNPWKTTIPQYSLRPMVTKFIQDFVAGGKMTPDLLQSIAFQVAQTNNLYNRHIGEAELLTPFLKQFRPGDPERFKPKYPKAYPSPQYNETQITFNADELTEDTYLYSVVDFLNKMSVFPVTRLTVSSQNQDGQWYTVEKPMYLVRSVVYTDNGLTITFEKLNNLNKLYNLSGEYEASPNIPKHGFKSNLTSNNIVLDSKAATEVAYNTLPQITKNIKEILSKLQKTKGIKTQPTTETQTPATQQTIENKSFKLSVDKKGKDQGKADLANALITYPNTGTSSYTYMQDAKKQSIPVNEEIIASSKVVAMVSVNGNNKATKQQLDDTIAEANRIIQAGGTVIMDSTSDANRSWNKSGEAIVQKALGVPTGQTLKGYNYWGPNPEITQQPDGTTPSNCKPS
jgi:hypothetical protein